MAEDLFGKAPALVIDPDKDYFAELVGENAKFKTPQALARGKVESDLHISNLETELNEMRSKLNTQLTMQDFLDKMEAAQKARQPVTPNGNQSAEGEPKAEHLHKPELLSKDDVVSILRQEQEAAEQKRNMDAVTEALKKAWGASYQTELQKAVSGIGVSTKFLEDMAKTSPQAFLKLVGADTPSKTEADKSVFTPLGTRVNTATQSPTGTVKNYEYYRKLEQTDAKLFHSRAVQQERWEMAKKLGESFYS